MEPLTIVFVVFAGVVASIGLALLFIRDRSGALDDDKAGWEPRRGKRSAGFDDPHRDHD